MKSEVSRTSPYHPDLTPEAQGSKVKSRSSNDSSVSDHPRRSASKRNSDAFEKSQAKSFIQTPTVKLV